MFIGSNIHVGNMSNKFVSLYGQLIAEGTMLGRDLTVTNTRTGARKSVDSATTAEVAANTPDQFVLNNRLYCLAAMNGATNLVSSVLTDWTDAGAAVSSQVSVGLYRITLTAGAGSVLYAFASAANNRNLMCQARLVSGTVPATSIATFRGASTPLGTPFDLTTLTSSFQDVNPTVTSASTTDDVIFSLASGTCVIELQYIRAVDFLVKHPAFPDGSIAGATYGGDLLTFAPTLGSVGTIITGVYAYGWNGLLQNNPGADTNPRILYDSGSPVSLAWMGSNGQTFDWSGDSGVTKASSATDVSGTAFQVLRLDWNGTVYGLQLDDEARQTVAETGQPVGPIALGNRISVGEDEAHAAMIAPIIFDRILSDAEYAAILAGIQADCATFGGFR